MSKGDLPQVDALAAEGIRWVAITWVNHAGAPLVKVVPLAAFDAAVAVGVGFSPVADAFGAAGAIDPAHRLARPDGDLRLRADAAALGRLEPGSGWAWAPGERFERSGAPYVGDQRYRCRLQQHLLQRAGVELRAGFELEWLVARADAKGAPQPAVAGGPYGADRLVDALDYATALLQALEAAGIPWLQFHPEYGAGQFELSLAPGSPLEAADRLVQARLVIQRVTRRLGWYCSFSPKPSLERVGNGGHLHLSMQRDGVPLLEGGGGPGGLSDAGGAVLAALLQELPALLALACPLAISYRRLAPGSWSAPFQVWGIENREAALRLIPSDVDGAAAHLEIKVADLAANPYLLLAAVQAVVQAGMHETRPLPPPVSGDPAHLPAGAAVRLPATLAAASAAFASSTVLREALGEALHGSLLDSQAAEVRRCAAFSDAELAAADAFWPLVGGLPGAHPG
ncbi:MAG: GlnA3 [Cyanobacteriota bacterium]